jgi:hypothetical protein
MGEDRIEKMIRERLEFHRTPTDVDKIWEGIEKKRDGVSNAKEASNKGSLWIVLLFVVISTLAVSLSIYKSKDNVKYEGSAQSSSVLPDIADINSSTKTDKLRDKGKGDSSITQGKAKTNSKRENTSTTIAMMDGTTQQKSKINADNSKDEFRPTLVNNEQIKTSEKEQIKINNNTIVNDAKVEIDNVVSMSRSTNTENVELTTLHKNRVQKEIASNDLSRLKDVNKITQITADKNKSVQQISTSLFLLENKSRDRLAWNKPLLSYLPKEIIVQKEKAQWNHMVAFSTGVYYNYKNLSNIAEVEIDYANIRSATETPLETLEFSLQYALQSIQGYYFFTGINYLRITERFDYSGESSEILAGQNFTLSQLTKTVEKKIYNNSTIVDLPLGVGFRFHRGKWGFRIGASANVNLLTTIEGQQLDRNEQVVNRSGSSDYKRKLSIAFVSDIGIDYSLGKGWSISLDPTVRYYGKSFTIDESDIVEQHQFLGLKTGIRLLF